MTRHSWSLLALAAIVCLLGSPLAHAEPATRVSAGYQHSCAVTSSGAVWCWGNNEYGRLGDGTTLDRSTPAPVSGLTSGVAAVSAGQSHTCALTGAGTVWCWGLNAMGQLGDGSTTLRKTPVQVAGMGSAVVAIAAGAAHTCAITDLGAVWCWGANNFGQLGDGTTSNHSSPVAVGGGLGVSVASITAGPNYACAVTSGGTVRCWGRNDGGQLGDGTTTNRSTPVEVSGMGGASTTASAGDLHTCAVRVDGEVRCWGLNRWGQLGDGTTTDSLTPVTVSGLSGAASVAAGGRHTCALTGGGDVRCWGDNVSGQIGDGTTVEQLTPVAVGGVPTVSVLDAGSFHTCAVTTAAGVRCWGRNGYGQLGDATASFQSAPVSVSGLSATTTLEAGFNHTCAMAGTLACWGDGSAGQLGDGTTANRSTPAAVAGLPGGVLDFAPGGWHTCAVTSGGAVSCWGLNEYGQLGDGTTTDATTPVAVSGLGTGVKSVAAGNLHTCAVTNAGAVSCWGSNAFGQLGDGTTTDTSAPVAVSVSPGTTFAQVAAGGVHTCAVTSGGAVWCWGQNASGQLGDGTTTNRSAPVAVAGLSGVASVAVGSAHSCARTGLGALYCWGANTLGQLGDDTTMNRPTAALVNGLSSHVVSVATGGWHTCAVTTFGAVSCWGSNANGQLGDGTTTDRHAPVDVSGLVSGWSSIAAGARHSCAMTAAGAVSCWGRDDYGQLATGRVLDRLSPLPVVGLSPAPFDLNRDGRGDIVWRHAARGEVWGWRMTAGAPSSQSLIGTVGDANWQIKGVADITGDGKADLLWRHGVTGDLFLWTMSGNTRSAVDYLGAVSPEYAIVGTADYTGDGRADILWRHLSSGDLWLWEMNGATRVEATWIAQIAPAYAVAASGDCDADGRADILWRNSSNGEVWLWLMDGTTSLNRVYLGAVGDPHFEVAALVDHDRDGRADIVWRHDASGDVWRWRMSGTKIAAVSHLATVGDVNYRIAGAGDYDGDGKADLLWHHATRGEVWVWLMDGAAILSATRVATVADVGYQVQGSK